MLRPLFVPLRVLCPISALLAGACYAVRVPQLGQNIALPGI